MDKRIFWLASYPKSGNTWVRAMLSAYINYGHLDINKLVGSYGDADNYYLRNVSPVPTDELTYEERLALRPAQMMHLQETSPFHPVMVKTHTVNARTTEFPAIPDIVTAGAIYLVRDPRDVAISYSNHMGLTLDQSIERMGDESTALKEDGPDVKTVLTDWSGHVKSWLGKKPYQVTVIPYEDMLSDPAWALTNILTVMGWEVDGLRVKRAVEACRFDKMREQEDERGFKEQSKKSERFFRSGVSGGWREVLTDAQRKQIETDHAEVMQMLGYLEE